MKNILIKDQKRNQQLVFNLYIYHNFENHAFKCFSFCLLLSLSHPEASTYTKRIQKDLQSVMAILTKRKKKVGQTLYLACNAH